MPGPTLSSFGSGPDLKPSSGHPRPDLYGFAVGLAVSFGVAAGTGVGV